MKILITGGAGFIGSNLARHLSSKYEVVVFDSLGRGGSAMNLNWLGESVKFVKGYITDERLVGRLVGEANIILHLAAQVAVTNSIKDPREDFEVNALGTFNLLEAARKSAIKPLIIYSSTNKVYGKIDEERYIKVVERYIDPANPKGISENQKLDFYSPYGCSKGAADSYVRDYSRIYGLPTFVLRKSCVYGPRQFGTEDQGWVAHFIRKALKKEKITIYGDGKQTRDLLYIGDLVGLYDNLIELYVREFAGVKGIDSYMARFGSGKGVFNIGGGLSNSLSLLELIRKLEKLLGHKIDVEFKDWRPGDQKIYISDINKVRNEIGWEPKTSPDRGLKELIGWLRGIK
jgi:CDP-paratose 2-epimerase